MLWFILLCSALLGACSLLRPLDDLEGARGALAAEPCADGMQQVRWADGETFCIDRRETTRAEYEEFLLSIAEALPPPTRDAELCTPKASFEPGDGADCQSEYERGIGPELPVVCVDLCDAQAYCAFRGKRLCGGRQGVRAPQESVDGPEEDEWFAACTGGTGRQFPYGTRFEPGLCNLDSAGLLAADGAPGCETPDHIEQLSGNVGEWGLMCKAFTRRGGLRCLVRGGDYLTTDRALATCQLKPRNPEEDPRGELPTHRGPSTGIRCCSD